MTRCTHCADGTVSEWSDPDDADAGSIRTSQLLDPEVVARLVKQTVPCPVCGGTQEVPKWFA